MKFPAFDYAAPETIAEALEVLASDEAARPLAGGQSLLPMLALRLAAPSILVDLNGIADLRRIVVGDAGIRIGATVTHAENARSRDVCIRFPVVAQALGHLAHAAVRNRGTFGGSIALADAGAEMPLVVAALGGTMIIHGSAGERPVCATEFFKGQYTTAVQPGELLIAVDLPFTDLTWAFEETSRRSGDLAIAMVAVGVQQEDGICREARVFVGSLSDRPYRAVDAEALITGRVLTRDLAQEAGRLAAAGIVARADIHASADLRRQIAAVLIKRALLRLMTGDAR